MAADVADHVLTLVSIRARDPSRPLPILLGLIQGFVSSLVELFKRVVRTERREPDAERRCRMKLLQRLPHRMEALNRDVRRAAPQRAQELVAADSSDPIVGTQMRLDGRHDIVQQRVSGRMSLRIVD